MTDLHELSATDALELFRARALSPVELLDALIARAEEVEPAIRAFSDELFDQARAQARAAARRYAHGGEPPRPLEGLPVATKERQAITGHVVTHGVAVDGQPPAEATDLVVQRVVDAGAIVHARTTTAEFCCLPVSHARRWGVTCNPWSPQWSAGGSSGGAAAALAAGTTPLALGTDIGGSIRAPAAFCGVVGFKPPYGRVPMDPPTNLDTWLHTGPMARTIADCALLQNVLAGPHSLDVASLRPALRIPAELGPVAGLRIGCVARPGDFPVAAEVAEQTIAVAGALADLGAIVEPVEVDWRLADVNTAMWGHFGGAVAELRAFAEAHPDALSPYTLAFVAKASEMAARTMPADGLRAAARVYAALGPVLERYDALIFPTMGAIGFEAGEDYVERPLVVDGRAVEHFADASLTPAFNICSRCAVLAVPSGRASNGVPTGVQIVGRTFDDVTVFRVGAAIEAARPWPRLAPIAADADDVTG